MIALALSPTVSGVIAVVVAGLLGIVVGVIAGASTVNALEVRVSLLRRTLMAIANRDGGDSGDRALDALAADGELAETRGTKRPDRSR